MREDENSVIVRGNRYTKLECVGRGGSSKVFKVRPYASGMRSCMHHGYVFGQEAVQQVSPAIGIHALGVLRREPVHIYLISDHDGSLQIQCKALGGVERLLLCSLNRIYANFILLETCNAWEPLICCAKGAWQAHIPF